MTVEFEGGSAGQREDFIRQLDSCRLDWYVRFPEKTLRVKFASKEDMGAYYAITGGTGITFREDHSMSPYSVRHELGHLFGYWGTDYSHRDEFIGLFCNHSPLHLWNTSSRQPYLTAMTEAFAEAFRMVAWSDAGQTSVFQHTALTPEQRSWMEALL